VRKGITRAPINAGLAFSAIQRPFLGAASLERLSNFLELSRLRKMAKDNQELAVPDHGAASPIGANEIFIPPVMSKESDLTPRAMDSFRNAIAEEKRQRAGIV
jgi:hypothetical protein